MSGIASRVRTNLAAKVPHSLNMPVGAAARKTFQAVRPYAFPIAATASTIIAWALADNETPPLGLLPLLALSASDTNNAPGEFNLTGLPVTGKTGKGVALIVREELDINHFPVLPVTGKPVRLNS